MIPDLDFMVLGKQFVHKAKIRVNEKKKRSSGNKITGIQVFFLETYVCQSQSVMLFISLINLRTPKFVAVFP